MPNAAFVYNVGFAVFLGIRYTLDLIYAQRDHLSFPIVQVLSPSLFFFLITMKSSLWDDGLMY
jgi:hypothetical protein